MALGVLKVADTPGMKDDCVVKDVFMFTEYRKKRR